MVAEALLRGFAVLKKPADSQDPSLGLVAGAVTLPDVSINAGHFLSRFTR